MSGVGPILCGRPVFGACFRFGIDLSSSPFSQRKAAAYLSNV